VPNYLPWAVLCTIFCFTGAGIVGIIFSLMAKRRASAGDLDRALRAARTAKTWCWISLILGLVAYLLLAVGAFHLPSAKT
jgi:TRAP-type C4-dicarboxylate transport system permease small subunit